MIQDHSLQISSHADGEVGTVTLSGQLMAESRFELEQLLRVWTGNGIHFIVVDCGDLSFIDSAGLSTLIGGMHRLRQVRGELVLARMNPRVEALFEVTMLTRYFKFFPEGAEAEAWLKSAAKERAREGGAPDVSEVKPAGKPKPRTKPMKKSKSED
jgi:anti-sigma B factor antagonist